MSVLRISQRTTSNKKFAVPLPAAPASVVALGTTKFTLLSGNVSSYSTNTGHRVAFVTTSSSIFADQASNIEYVMVAGGGGGGGWSGGGGGAGGMIQGNITLVAGNTYSFVVGAGGSGAAGTVYPDSGKTDGGHTYAFSLIAYGGGQGGQYAGWTQDQVDGGSGGGSAFPGNQQGNGYGYPGPAQQGYPGSSWYDNYAGGGGGGAGQAGNTKNGGNGRIISWLEPSTYSGNIRNIGQVWGGQTYLAGGGSGGSFGSSSGNAGLGGGGKGAMPSIPAGISGNVNTGGGGGAADTTSPTGTSQSGATSGGSGVVILRYIP